MESIGEEAFADCESLISITISKSVKTIGENAFACWSYLDGKLSCKSSNNKMVSIDSKEDLTIRGKGSATVTVTSRSGGDTVKVKFNII